jgi:tetratricopeptide (TPR) repeat protein
LAAGVLLVTLLPGVQERARQMFSIKEGSNAARIAGWKAALNVWKAHPILGSGPDTFFQAFRPHRDPAFIHAAGAYVTQADAHNDFLQIAATQGTLGAAAWLILLLVLMKSARPALGDSRRAGFTAALIALAVQNQFNFSSVATSAWAAVFAAQISARDDVWQKPVSALARGFLALIVLACPCGVWAALQPVLADAAYKRGQGQVQQGQALKALADYELAVRLQGRIELYQTELANAYRRLAELSADPARKQRYFDQAWAVTDAETRRHPHNPDPWNNRGVAAMWMIQLAGRDLWQEARRSFEEATRLDPMFVDAWANLAKWEHLSGHLDEEKTFWRKVLEIDPTHPMAQEVLQLKMKGKRERSADEKL